MPVTAIFEVGFKAQSLGDLVIAPEQFEFRGLYLIFTGMGLGSAPEIAGMIAGGPTGGAGGPNLAPKIILAYPD